MAAIINYPIRDTWEQILQRPTQSVEAIEAVVNTFLKSAIHINR